MKLPKLPSLKRRKGTSGPRQLKRASRLPPLASAKRSKDVPQWSTVDRKKGGWGQDIWFEVDGAATEKAAVGGTCAKCGHQVRAIDLTLRRDKEGNEYWKCIWC